MSIVSQGRIVSEVCSHCEATVVTEVVQRLIDRSLRWSASRSCRSCGLEQEIECDEDGMEDMRQLMIEDSAFWLDVKTAPKAVIMAALRSVVPMSIQEAGKQATEILNRVWQATRPEATLLAHALADRGHSSEVRRHEGAVR